MAVSLVGRLAARAAVPVHTVAGVGADSAVAGLRAHEALWLVASPRHATILLVGGPVTDDLIGVVSHVHDQLPRPRGVMLRGGADAGALGIDGTVTVEGGAAAGEVAGVIRRVHHELVTGHRPSTAFVGPVDNPVAWQGEGPHGRGGDDGRSPRPKATRSTDRSIANGRCSLNDCGHQACADALPSDLRVALDGGWARPSPVAMLRCAPRPVPSSRRS